LATLSFAGKIVLIKLVLAAMPTYAFSNAWIPNKIVIEMERICIDFLWGEGDVRKGLHLIVWDIVCNPKERGGLGIRSLINWRDALLGKQIMKILKEEENLWSKVVIQIQSAEC